MSKIKFLGNVNPLGIKSPVLAFDTATGDLTALLASDFFKRGNAAEWGRIFTAIVGNPNIAIYGDDEEPDSYRDYRAKGGWDI